MGFIMNIMEDMESYIVNLMSEDSLIDIRRQQEKLNVFKQSLDYRMNDVVYLIKNGFTYKNNNQGFTKTENIDYGKYPGEYKISVGFPKDYPKSPPNIRFKPLFSKGRIHPHLSDNGTMCVAKVKHGAHNSFWRDNMNARGALRLAYNLVTGEIDKEVIYKKEKERPTLSIKGTILSRLKKAVSKDVFVKDFLKKINKEIDNTYSWKEIAFVTSKFNKQNKIKMIEYYKGIKGDK